MVSTQPARHALRGIDVRAALLGTAAALAVAAVLGGILVVVLAAADAEWSGSVNDADQRLTVIGLICPATETVDFETGVGTLPHRTCSTQNAASTCRIEVSVSRPGGDAFSAAL